MYRIVAAIRMLAWPVLCGILVAMLIMDRMPGYFGDQSEQRNASDELAETYAQAVQRASPAVVNIYTSKKVERAYNPLLDDPVLRNFFGTGTLPRRERIERSLGSGVIVDKGGYILTNNHVIAGADEILVLLYDGRETFAKVIGTDPETDLAVLKINLDHLHVIDFGDPAKARVGDIVLAIGNPYGFGQTVTQGIISAKGRWGLNLSTYENYLQTDADINPGNSGGALVDSTGHLLGINSAIYTRSGGSQGIGLAIPVDIARRVMKDIIEHGHVIRGWLGVEVQEISPALASSLGLTHSTGVVITGIYPNGPADAAGLQQGDVITAINGKPIHDGRSGMMQVARLAPGQKVPLEIARQGKKMKVEVRVGVRPAEQSVQQEQQPGQPP